MLHPLFHDKITDYKARLPCLVWHQSEHDVRQMLFESLQSGHRCYTVTAAGIHDTLLLAIERNAAQKGIL